MKVDLEPAKAVLRMFQADLDKIEEWRQSMIGPMPATAFSIQDKQPIFDPEQKPDTSRRDSEEEAYRWLYAEAMHPHSLMHRPKSNPVPDYYQQLAWLLHQNGFQVSRTGYFIYCNTRWFVIPITSNSFLCLQSPCLSNSKKKYKRCFFS